MSSPTHFSLLFRNLVEGVQSFVDSLPAGAPEPFFWFDCFVLDQHAQSSQGAEWWRTTFKRAIGNIGHTLMMMSPWDNPIPLSRSWCLWELFCTHDTEANFSVCLGPAEQTQFRESIVSGSDIVMKAFASIDVRKAKAGKAEDQKRILDAVEESVGSDQLNAIALREIRTWLVSEARQLLSGATIKGRNQISCLFKELGFYEECGRINDGTLVMCNTAEPSLDVGKTYNNMAMVYYEQGKHALALEFYEKSLAIKKQCVGENHLEVGRTYMNMAKVYDEQKRFVEARDYFSRAKTIYTQTHGDRYTRWFDEQIERVSRQLSQD